jgi:hypothetical protein
MLYIVQPEPEDLLPPVEDDARIKGGKSTTFKVITPPTSLVKIA